MFKYVVFAAILALAVAIPAPEPKAAPKPKPAPKPSFVAYSAPIVASPLAYSAAYSAPVAYSAAYSAPVAYAAPAVYAGAYPYAYAPYSAPYVVV